LLASLIESDPRTFDLLRARSTLGFTEHLWPARKHQLGWMFLQYASDSRTTPKNKASKLRRWLPRHKPSSDGRHDTASQHTRKSGSSEFLNAQNLSKVNQDP